MARFKRALAVLFVLGFVTSGLPAVALDLIASEEALSSDGGVIVVLNDSVSDSGAVATEHATRFGISIHHVYTTALKGYAASGAVARAQILADRRVRFVATDRKVVVPDGEGLSSVLDPPAYEYWPNAIQRIFARSDGPNAVPKGRVAILGSGIGPHPELQDLIDGERSSSCSPGNSLPDSRTTHLAGLIAARRDGQGLVGVAPGARISDIQVANSEGIGRSSSLLCGLDFLIRHSPSRGGEYAVALLNVMGAAAEDECGPSSRDPVHIAICRGTSEGVTFVAAAGDRNESLDASFPASYDEVISVTNLDDADGAPCGADDVFSPKSNYAREGDRAHVVGAPGKDVVGVGLSGKYESRSGTPQAAALVAGAIVQFKQHRPKANTGDVIRWLNATGERAAVSHYSECVGNDISHASSPNHSEVVVRVQDDVALVQRYAEAEASSSFGGVWFDPSSEDLIHVAFTNDQAKHMLALSNMVLNPAGLRVEQVEHSFEFLLTLQRRVDGDAGRLRAQGIEITGTGIVPDKNRVIVYVDQRDSANESRLAKRYGENAILIGEEPYAVLVNRFGPPPWVGGMHLIGPYIGADYVAITGCSSAFTMYNYIYGVQFFYMATAGHCFQMVLDREFTNVRHGDNPDDDFGRWPVGRVSQRVWYDGAPVDGEIINIDTYGTWSRLIETVTNRRNAALGVSPYPVQNDDVWRSGISTNERFLRNTVINRSVTYLEDGQYITIYNMIEANCGSPGCLTYGDSGGPIYDYPAGSSSSEPVVVEGALSGGAVSGGQFVKAFYSAAWRFEQAFSKYVWTNANPG